MSELPSSWQFASLLEVACLLRGVTFSKGDSSEGKGPGLVPVLRATNIVGRELVLSDLVYVPKQFVTEDQMVRRGDTVVATSSGSISVVGKAGHARRDLGAAFGAFCGLLRPCDGIEPRYLGHFLSSDEYRRAASEMAQGVNINNLKREHFASFRLPVAPLAEQRRIADKLDDLLARVDECRDRLDRVSRILKRFRQAVLAVATSGELTRDWRGGEDAHWDEMRIEQLCLNERYALSIGPFGSDLKVADYRTEGVPLVFVREVRARNFGGRATKFVTAEKAEDLKAHSVRAGDLLITKMGDPPGDIAIYPYDRPPAIMTADVVCMRVDPHVAVTSFVGFAIESPFGRECIAEITAGVAQQKISLERLRTMSIPVPSLEEQVEIVSRVRELFEVLERIEQRVSLAQESIERATPALLTKAFLGELVPQDPNDEPASVLLERIRAVRTAAGPDPKKRGRSPKIPVGTEA